MEHSKHKNETAVLTSKEAADYLGLAEATLRKARMEGLRDGHFPTPPYVRLGRAVRYLKADLDKWLESHRVTGKRG